MFLLQQHKVQFANEYYQVCSKNPVTQAWFTFSVID